MIYSKSFLQKIIDIRKICISSSLYNIDEIKAKFLNEFENQFDKIIIMGNLVDRAVLLAKDEIGILVKLSSSFQSYSSIDLFKNQNIVSIKDEIIFKIDVSEDFLKKIERPHIGLVGLFHPEYFPLPRFHLGLSDLAGAIRKNYRGKVFLMDMQLGIEISEIVKNLIKEDTDIIAISITFGQQDLLEELLFQINNSKEFFPLVIIGGSLAALNAKHILNKYPDVIIGNGYGETTMVDVVRYWQGLKPKNEINDISYIHKGIVVKTKMVIDDKSIFALPELDLLPATLKKRGVMQLESSRGCTYACSFCPRNHKGKWSGNIGEEFDMVLKYLDKIFSDFPKTYRKIFLVDEEFIGYSFKTEGGVENRAIRIAKSLTRFKFKFESSTRIDQIHRPHKGSEWHEERIIFWKKLKKNGLEKMLFGVESGVNSILKRFNKKVSAEQNVIALRILTSIGIPIRLTYITFDPLMNMSELIESYLFQGRKDIILIKKESLTPQKIYESVFNDSYINLNQNNTPVFYYISYLLVSMESLLGSKYLELVENEGLGEEISLSMGKRKARYKNETIGLLSHFSQKWVDRIFALDYIFKSIIKISKSDIRTIVNDVRLILKISSYQLLGKMLVIVNDEIKLIPDGLSSIEILELEKKAKNWVKVQDIIEKQNLLQLLLNDHFNILIDKTKEAKNNLKPFLPKSQFKLISSEIENIEKKNIWELIND